MNGEPLFNNLAEAAGYALIVAFLWFVWPPLVLLGAGVLLVVWANVRAARPASTRAKAVAAAAVKAARAAWAEQPTAELRRIA